MSLDDVKALTFDSRRNHSRLAYRLQHGVSRDRCQIRLGKGLGGNCQRASPPFLEANAEPRKKLASHLQFSTIRTA